MQELRFLIALWLTIAATGAWADTVDSLTVADQTADCPDGLPTRTIPIPTKV